MQNTHLKEPVQVGGKGADVWVRQPSGPSGVYLAYLMGGAQHG